MNHPRFFKRTLNLRGHDKGHSRVSTQNLPPHVLTWNFCHRFASMWRKISPNDNPRNSFFWELWRGKDKFRKWFFLKTAWPILMKKIYVVETNEAIPQKKEFLKKIVAKKIFWIFRNFFWGYVREWPQPYFTRTCLRIAFTTYFFLNFLKGALTLVTLIGNPFFLWGISICNYPYEDF